MNQPTRHAAIAWSEIDTTNYPVVAKRTFEVAPRAPTFSRKRSRIVETKSQLLGRFHKRQPIKLARH